MRNGIILKIITSLALFAVFAVAVWFVLTQTDKRGDVGNEKTTPEAVSEPLRVYTEEEKIGVLKNLAETNIATQTAKDAPVSIETTSSVASKQEAQERTQVLEQIAPPANTVTPSDAEKLRILNSLKSTVQ